MVAYDKIIEHMTTHVSWGRSSIPWYVIELQQKLSLNFNKVISKYGTRWYMSNDIEIQNKRNLIKSLFERVSGLADNHIELCKLKDNPTIIQLIPKRLQFLRYNHSVMSLLSAYCEFETAYNELIQ